jgi:DNA replication and repair protein RecF
MSERIVRLQLENFRNIETDVIEFGPKINCIFGQNGNGKTNILEAIHILATKKSFRKNSSFPQFLSVDGEKPEIILSSVFQKNENEEKYSLSTRMNRESTEWFINGRVVKRKPTIPLVFVNPSDSYQFMGTASFRRNWFDYGIGLIEREYKVVLNRYNGLLRNRNALLSKKPRHFREQIEALDPLLAKDSFFLVQRRREFLSELSPLASAAFKDIFSENHDLLMNLESKFSNLSEEGIGLELCKGLEKDEVIGFTTKGVHKDDYVLQFDGFNAYEYCSLGQQKMAYLSVLFAYIELFRYKFMSFPIVLIDDVSGELDSHRWQKLVQFLEQSKFQVLITTANEKFKEELDKIQDAHKIFVNSGSIS